MSSRLSLTRTAFAAAFATVVLAVIGVPAAAIAQPTPACVSRERGTAADSGVWRAPLDRRVTISAHDVTLREALDRAAKAGHVRLAYSSELLPSGRRVCVALKKVAVGSVFEDLLAGTDLEAVAASGDQVVLRRVAPRIAATVIRADTTVLVQQLDAVVVTATLGRPAIVDGTSSLTTIDRAELARRDDQSLAGVLDGRVPGVWSWSPSASPLLSAFASVRGASAFGASSPKTYIDGIEVANPLVAMLVGSENIEQVDVIRGPQGASLFGADALNGVVNITTRHEGSATGAFDLHMKSTAGVIQSQFATTPLLAQTHSMTLRAGTAARSFGLAVSNNSTGAYIPGAQSQQTSALATARVVGARTMLAFTGRFADARATDPRNPLLDAASGSVGSASDSTSNQALREYTAGVTAQMLPAGRWTHTASVGIDGYRLAGLPVSSQAMTVVSNDTMSATSPAADRVSLRASSVLRLRDDNNATTTMTFGVEHTALRQVTTAWMSADPPPSFRTVALHSGPGEEHTMTAPPPSHGPVMEGEPTSPSESRGGSETAVAWQRNTGASMQFDAALHRTLFLTGGLRLERTSLLDASSRVSALPMLGVAIVGSRDDKSVKLRAGYGKGIRSPRATPFEMIGFGGHAPVPQASLVPEEQRGVEAGIDIALGRAASLHVTRFDQLASGLVQQVSLPSRNGRTIYGFGNVGEITNRGWELEQQVAFGPLSVHGTLSFVDSRVRSVAGGYTGELRPGDRMLGVPAMTSSLSFGYQTGRSAAMIDISHASDWINYDVLALARNTGASGSVGLTNSNLRDYWLPYSGVTRLRATVSRNLAHGLVLVVTGDNLLGVQRGAPDNGTIVPGRTTMVGLRVRL
jgi:iron complex outermembrane receptor protein